MALNKKSKSLSTQRANVQRVIASAVAADSALSAAELAVDGLNVITSGYSG